MVANGGTNIYKDAANRDVKNMSNGIKRKHRIYLSGQGADEITSDYGLKEKIYNHSCFGGKYPGDLTIVDNDQKRCNMEIILWRNTKNYWERRKYIRIIGIEGRYPFLDKYLVQEFLSLSPTLKNKLYKAPLDYFLKRHRYPYDKNTKIGFSADVNLK